MITVRRARPGDAVAIGAVHVAAWRSAYPGILPDALPRRASRRRGRRPITTARSAAAYGVHVATASGVDAARPGGRLRGGRLRHRRPVAPAAAGPPRLGEGEIETLYVLDDWRERGLGRRLMRAAAANLAGAGCRSAFVWVLRDNPSRWFYERLGGKAVAEATISVGGTRVVQTAYVWSPIERLVQATSAAGVLNHRPLPTFFCPNGKRRASHAVSRHCSPPASVWRL